MTDCQSMKNRISMCKVLCAEHIEFYEKSLYRGGGGGSRGNIGTRGLKKWEETLDSTVWGIHSVLEESWSRLPEPRPPATPGFSKS